MEHIPKEKFLALAKENADTIINIRQHIHQNPELSFQEFKTSAFISEKLSELYIPHKTGIVKTGIVGIIEGKNPSQKTVALRADIDALPITEDNRLPYKSRSQGVMHACGHDVHTSSLLGAASILNQLKSNFEGRILLVFQPGEELLPGGALQMINEGAFDEFPPDLFIGQHVDPNLEAGKIGIKAGPYMASTDDLYLKVNGKGGHGAIPDKVIDPVLIASHIIIALQQVVSRNAKPYVPTVVSFGKVTANGATNVIPNEVYLEGTFRTFDEEWRKQANEIIRNMAIHTAKAMGGDCEVEIQKGYPFLINDEKSTEQFKKIIKNWIGENNLVDLSVEMTAEDFAYFSRNYPSLFYRLGTRNEKKGITSALHTTTFKVENDILAQSSATMAWLAYNFLKS